MPPLTRLLTLVLALVSLQPARAFTDLLPDGSAPAWNQPAVELTTTRATLDLSGPWRFTPGTFTDAAAPAGEWGWIRVPGNWMARNDNPILARGSDGDWDSLASREKSAAWYRRTVDIPASWAGRSIVLAFDKISTDAVVWVGNVKAGSVAWPGGELELAHLLTPGRHTLTLRVLAASEPGIILVAMGDNEGQNETRKSQLNQTGLIKTVRLISRPAGPRVDDVFVRTSTRKNEVSLDLTLAALTADQTTYERRTRWRWTRVIAQLAANLGASLEQDAALFGTATFYSYHPDWRADFALGDEPYRFYNW